MKNKSIPWKAYLANLLAVLLLFFIYEGVFVGMPRQKYVQGIIMLVCINVVLSASLNLTTGFLGQIALGHAGFMSIGAYTSAIITKNLSPLVENLPSAVEALFFFGALLCGGLMAALFGLIVGVPALRLKGDYLAIITLGFGEIIRVLIENMGDLTGGAAGLKSIPRYSGRHEVVVFVVTVLTVVILFNFVHSRHGRAITAIREDDIASEASGIPNTYYKVLAFTIAAFFGGIAGGVYAHHIGVLNASYFGFMRSIEILVIVVLGGMGSITGSIVAAIGLTVLPEALRSFSEYRMLLYSIALILVMMFKPSGLFGRYEFSLYRALSRLGKKSSGTKSQKGGE